MSGLKKTMATIVAIGMLAPAAVFAQSTSTSSISALLTQLHALQTQMMALQQQQVQAYISLASTLKQGSKGENVRILQQLLAQDPSLYPEGTISGFYGKLTAKAVKRFQKQHGFEQVGDVGPKTLKRLNELFARAASSTKSHNDEEGNNNEDADEVHVGDNTPGIGKVTICHKPGKSNQTLYVGAPALSAHLKHGDTSGACNGGTVTPDRTPPVISSIVVSAIATTTATVSWTTNEAANGTIFYSTSTPVNLATAPSMSTTTLSMSHSFVLTGLATSTTYMYVLKSQDAAGNTATSSEHSFVTTN